MTKKKKKRRTAKGCKQYFVRGKTGKRCCAICGSELQGVPHGKTRAELGKMSKTEKRPSVPFGGVLCTKCRRIVAEEEAKLNNGLKALGSVDLRIRKYVKIKGASA